MPELPEVEVLVEHLRPQVRGRLIQSAIVNRARVIRPLAPRAFARMVRGWRIHDLSRRAKYLVFDLKRGRERRKMLGHLGMSGRMYVQAKGNPLPRHAPVVFELGKQVLVFEDIRYFGRFLLDDAPLELLGPEPLGAEFSVPNFTVGLGRSAQPIKQRLLDQCLVAGLGNIYASEALFHAKIHPATPSRKLTNAKITSLHKAIREVLRRAIKGGSTLPIAGARSADRKKSGLYYFGETGRRRSGAKKYGRRLLVYDREGKPCARCGTEIEKMVQGARSTFFCPKCQKK